MTRIPASLTTGMHGIEHRIPERWTRSPLCSTKAGFACSRFNASWRAAAASAMKPFARNGLSLARNGRRISRLPFRGQRSWPATSLTRLRLRVPVRSFGSTTLKRFAPLPAASLPRTRCLRPRRLFRPLGPSPLPLGAFVPSGSKRSTDAAAFRSTFRIRPISARSPPPGLFLDAGFGSSSAVRYVSGGLLFLKPLGTFYTMRPPLPRGQRFFAWFRPYFNRILNPCFQRFEGAGQ